MQRASGTTGFARALPLRPVLSSAIAEPAVPLGDADELVRRTYAALMRRGAVRRLLHQRGRDHQLDKAHSKAYAHTSALAVLMDQMRRFRRAGSSLEELLRIPEALYEFSLDLSGASLRALDTIDREEARVDADEDVLQMRRRVDGESPASLRQEADVCARLATLNHERALVLRRRASRLELAQGVA